jgi:hypothetical protein
MDQLNGRSLRKMRTSLVVRSDASEGGGGFRVFKVDENDELHLVFQGSIPLTILEAAGSSTAREAVVLAAAVKATPPQFLRGAVIEGVVDNKGLARRAVAGSRNTEVNEPLLDMFVHMHVHDAAWNGMWWAARQHIDVEDGLSRVMMVDSAKMMIDRGWFIPWLKSMKVPPNVDAFASPNDRVPGVATFATKDAEAGARHDGLRCRWREDDVLWAFPPLKVLSQAVKNWRLSRSRVAYFVIPAIRRESHVAAKIRLSAQECWEDVPVMNIPEGAEASWKFDVVLLRKEDLL